MKKSTLFLLFLAVQTVVLAQEYFPEGTKWTEIRLDTIKYDRWYSKVGDEWVPNFETIEYYVQGDLPDRDWVYKKVYTSGPEWTDSLTLLIREQEYNGHNSVLVSVLVRDYDGKSFVLWPGEAYQFDWNIGQKIYYEDILMLNTTDINSQHHNYGIIDEIKEGDFGGVKSQKYVDLNDRRIIHGIGIMEWNDGECLFGPPNPYSALTLYENYHWELYPERHYRSRLVHFERNGEVFYDIWPKKGETENIKSINKAEAPSVNTLYDLKGRKLQQIPQKGLYIQNDKKVIVK